jgi:hypothetical protein
MWSFGMCKMGRDGRRRRRRMMSDIATTSARQENRTPITMPTMLPLLRSWDVWAELLAAATSVLLAESATVDDDGGSLVAFDVSLPVAVGVAEPAEVGADAKSLSGAAMKTVFELHQIEDQPQAGVKGI